MLKNYKIILINYLKKLKKIGNIMVKFVWLLTLLFIGLKLSNIITWSWLFVCSPPFIFVILYTIFFMCQGMYLYKTNPLKFKFWCLIHNIKMKERK